MREPTDKMYDAGDNEIGDTCDGHNVDPERVWRVMIDEALRD
jgi:hypothetical protein